MKSSLTMIAALAALAAGPALAAPSDAPKAQPPGAGQPDASIGCPAMHGPMMGGSGQATPQNMPMMSGTAPGAMMNGKGMMGPNGVRCPGAQAGQGQTGQGQTGQGQAPGKDQGQTNR